MLMMKILMPGLNVVDPVCWRLLYGDEVAGIGHHEGRTYYFCSEDCRAAFELEPWSYSGPPPRPLTT